LFAILAELTNLDYINQRSGVFARATMMVAQNIPAFCKIAPYLSRDRVQAMHLLDFLPTLYPGGLAWLARRLDDVERGDAHCWLAKAHNKAVGILIDTPKGKRSHKLSTIFVKNSCVGLRLGAALYSSVYRLWLEQGIDHVHVTVPAIRKCSIESFLLQRQFSKYSFDSNRYGDGRDEIVYSLHVH
jgi:hypothetical protein